MLYMLTHRPTFFKAKQHCLHRAPLRQVQPGFLEHAVVEAQERVIYLPFKIEVGFAQLREDASFHYWLHMLKGTLISHHQYIRHETKGGGTVSRFALTFRKPSMMAMVPEAAPNPAPNPERLGTRSQRHLYFSDARHSNGVNILGRASSSKASMGARIQQPPLIKPESK